MTRRAWLLSKPPTCKCGKTNHSLLTDAQHYPAIWHCLNCTGNFYYEPGPKDTPLTSPTYSEVLKQ